MEITKEFLVARFEYINGGLYWKTDYTNKKVAGKKAGTIANQKGILRRYIKLNGKRYLISRLTFFYHNGYWPLEVDHKDRDSLNDSIENLRECNRSQNSKNMNSRSNSSSKYLGVNYHIVRKKWQAQITINKKAIYLGMYNSEDEAGCAYNAAAIKYHGDFANLNIIA